MLLQLKPFIQNIWWPQKKTHLGASFFLEGKGNMDSENPRKSPHQSSPFGATQNKAAQSFSVLFFHGIFPNRKNIPWTNQPKVRLEKKMYFFFLGGGEKRGRFANQGPLVLLPWPCWPWQGPWIVLPRSESFFFQKIWGIV